MQLQDKYILLNILLEKCVSCYIVLKLMVFTHLPFRHTLQKQKNKKTKTKTVGQKGKTVKYVRHIFRRRRRKRRKREEYRLISSPEEEEEEPEQIGVRD